MSVKTPGPGLESSFYKSRLDGRPCAAGMRGSRGGASSLISVNLGSDRPVVTGLTMSLKDPGSAQTPRPRLGVRGPRTARWRTSGSRPSLYSDPGTSAHHQTAEHDRSAPVTGPARRRSVAGESIDPSEPVLARYEGTIAVGPAPPRPWRPRSTAAGRVTRSTRSTPNCPLRTRNCSRPPRAMHGCDWRWRAPGVELASLPAEQLSQHAFITQKVSGVFRGARRPRRLDELLLDRRHPDPHPGNRRIRTVSVG